MRCCLQCLASGGLVALASFCAAAANLTTAVVQPGGQDWTFAIWKANGVGTATNPVAGNTYQCVSNGVAFGNNTANTRIRNPTLAGVVTFPGDSLTLGANTELRMKVASNGIPILNFPGVSGSAGLILSNGFLNVGDDAVFSITGRIQVASQSYISPADAGGGIVKPLRGLNVTGQLTGNGTLVLMNGGTSVPQQFSGKSNTFWGNWIVKGPVPLPLSPAVVVVRTGPRLPLESTR